MKPLFVIASLLLMGAPSLASTNSGTIDATGTVAATCSVGDVAIELLRDGDDKLRGSGTIQMSQTGTTEWEISTTKSSAEQEVTYTPVLYVDGPQGMTLTSTDTQTTTETLNGAFSDNATVEIVLEADSGHFSSGYYATQTTVSCTVQ